MITLSHGFLKPENPDTGDEFFPAMENNIQLMNDHNHDGVNSAPLASSEIEIQNENWDEDEIGGGIYSQTVTLPPGADYDTIDLWFRLSTGDIIYPRVDRISATQFKIYTNDNTLTYYAKFR